MQINLKKIITAINVFNSILKDNEYVSVSDLAIFLNVFYGTYSITGRKINDMLEFEEYQRIATEEDSIDIKYLSLEKGENYSKIEEISTENGTVKRLVWKARVILDVFRVDFSNNADEIEDSFYNGIYENALINTDKDEIDYDLFTKNMEFLTEEMNTKNEI